MEEKHKHLELIQEIVKRMNQNSFQLKGWMITIVSALLALFASSKNVIYIFVAGLPVFIFWFLDAYYLQQERKFRGLYKDIVDDERSIKPFSMSLDKYEKGEYNFFEVLFSISIALLYIPIFILLIGGGIYLLHYPL